MKYKILLPVAILALSLNSCSNTRFHYFFMDMAYSPAIDAQEIEKLGGRKGNMVPPENTIPYNQHTQYLVDLDMVGVTALKVDGKEYGRMDGSSFARDVKSPLANDEKTIERGKHRFNIYCAPCHGVTGEGNGPVQAKIPHVSSLVKTADVTPLSLGWSVEELYLVASIGVRTMPGYASQVPEKDRWAIAHYVKALQKGTAK